MGAKPYRPPNSDSFAFAFSLQSDPAFSLQTSIRGGPALLDSHVFFSYATHKHARKHVQHNANVRTSKDTHTHAHTKTHTHTHTTRREALPPPAQALAAPAVAACAAKRCTMEVEVEV